ncbi:hypothetical protein NX059_008391 [Plenodomus lindquistii]|nr:hypothetical protein NX059_008391 [Plenodomus lindquistii]
MHASTILTALALPFALAAPAPPPPRLPFPHTSHIYSRQNDSMTPAPAPSPPICDLSTLVQPPNTLTPPTPSMRLVLIALGHGTQNYTCATPSSAPSSIGALATLYDASCALSLNPSTATTDLAAVQDSAAVIGTHFFVDNTTPDFDIPALGNTQVKKVEDVNAPDAKDVKWLRLQAQEVGTTSLVKMVYRLGTVGGVAPATCEGRGAGEVVTVEYEAQYWIYA